MSYYEKALRRKKNDEQVAIANVFSPTSDISENVEPVKTLDSVSQQCPLVANAVCEQTDYGDDNLSQTQSQPLDLSRSRGACGPSQNNQLDSFPETSRLFSNPSQSVHQTSLERKPSNLKTLLAEEIITSPNAVLPTDYGSIIDQRFQSENPDLSQLPNADIINRCLQETMSLASFEPISDAEFSRLKASVKSKMNNNSTPIEYVEVPYTCNNGETRCFENQACNNVLPGNKVPNYVDNNHMYSALVAEGHDPIPNIASPTENGSDPLVMTNFDKSGSSHRLNVSSWVESQRQMTNQINLTRQMNIIFLKMLKRWEEYLMMSFEELRQVEIEAARAMSSCDDVIEMLGDKDRYVWELVEGLGSNNSEPQTDTNGGIFTNSSDMPNTE